ncbi:hypothetical protein PLESTB_000818600 [Pleodorina starrii]|uniref:Uncharacterized protein n=1 Tax=Pleodorina starrii TaxID=330485 RepID=A0A9W6BL14_9CHLO|nr:hypothetical protein PLESTM_000134500 [Pleodorina starrii]GLC54054.1 hypothetical protein PLESTB_000818600 [Pleodorina starrii]GLC64638.1 hypothetical protein PLESTF_000187500 [Pleodorina starrii]
MAPHEALQVPFESTLRDFGGISVPSFLSLPLGKQARLDSQRTKTTIQRTLAAELNLPLTVVEKAALRARTSSSGDSSEFGLEKLHSETFETFAEKSGVLIADLGPALKAGADDRALLTELQNQMRMVCDKVERQNSEIAILRQGNVAYAAVLRRSLIEETHDFLLRTAGPRKVSPDGKVEQWSDYIYRLVDELGLRWFKEKKLPKSCLSLLPKGSNTPFELGNDAAHKLRTQDPDLFRQNYLMGVSQEEQPVWEELHKFVSTLP